jgi:hypothetical protein
VRVVAHRADFADRFVMHSTATSQDRKLTPEELLAELERADILPAGVIELRVLDARTRPRQPDWIETVNGFFDPEHRLEFCQAALADYGPSAKAYVTLQEIDDACLNRHVNRASPIGKRKATGNSDVVRLCRFFLDVDPKRRVKDVPATDAQKAEAKAVFDAVVADLIGRGWDQPVQVDSGNGFAGHWVIGLPPEDADLITRALKALAAKHDSDGANVDVTMGDPAQVRRVPGTLNRKGEATAERPHRPCRILSVPKVRKLVSREQLEELATEYQEQEEQRQGAPSANGRHRFLPEKYLAEYKQEFRRKGSKGSRGQEIWIVKCPFDDSHNKGEVCITVDPSGSIGFKCFHESCSEKHWPQCREKIGPILPHHWDPPKASSTEAPNPDFTTPPEQPWPEPMAGAAFHGPAGELVRTIEPHSEADPHALLIQLLVMAGNFIGRTAHWRTEGDIHYLNEFAVLLGDTSKARKGTSFGVTRRIFDYLDPGYTKERLQGGLSSGEGLIWAIRDPFYRTKDGQQELVDPGISDKRLLCFEPEFASILKHTERLGNTLSVVARQAWDGNSLRAMTKNSPAVCEQPHVSILGHCTVEEVRRYMSATEQANGFGNRYVWICAKRSKSLPEGGNVVDAEMARLVPIFEALLKRAAKVGCMGFTEAGRRAWHLVYGDLSEGRPGLGGAMVGRSEAHVRRLACIYALLDGQNNVDVVHLQAALAIWEYCEASVLYVFGRQTGDPLADEILGALHGCPDGMTRDDIRQFFQRNQRSSDIARALGLLLKFKLAYPTKEKTPGRSAERWRVGRAPAA